MKITRERFYKKGDFDMGDGTGHGDGTKVANPSALRAY